MRLYRQELNLIKKISFMSKLKVKIIIQGDIIFNETAYRNDELVLTINSGDLDISPKAFQLYLSKNFKFKKYNFSNFDWCDMLYMNYSEVFIDDKKMLDKECLYLALFEQMSSYYHSKTLMIHYLSKGHIYTSLYFTNSNLLYTEYTLIGAYSKFEKLLINCATIPEIIAKIKEFILLDISPNYETPNLKSYLYQLGKLAHNSNFSFRLKGGV